MSYTWVKTCKACGSDSRYLYQTLDLGDQPLANSLIVGEKVEETLYPLSVLTCTYCWHSQLSVDVFDPNMYGQYDYVSGTTQTLKNHFYDLADAIHKHFGSPRHRVIEHLDIGANDGTLCDEFGHRDFSFWSRGVDPAETLRLTSFIKDVNVLTAYWNEELGKQLAKSFECITACNVFAHNTNPYGFLRGCHHALIDEGIVVIEMPYAPRYMIDNPTEGHYYHEHQNYFTVNSFVFLAYRAGFHVFNITEHPIHGGTIRLWLEKVKEFKDTPEVVESYLNKETSLGLYKLETYKRFENTLKKNWDDLARLLVHYKRQGYFIVGYGASAKSSTLLNGPLKDIIKRNLGEIIDLIVDDNPRKVGKNTPGTHISIVDPQELSTAFKRPMAFLNLVYNFKDEVKDRLKTLRSGYEGDLFINYVPKVFIEEL